MLRKLRRICKVHHVGPYRIHTQSKGLPIFAFRAGYWLGWSSLARGLSPYLGGTWHGQHSTIVPPATTYTHPTTYTHLHSPTPTYKRLVPLDALLCASIKKQSYAFPKSCKVILNKHDFCGPGPPQSHHTQPLRHASPCHCGAPGTALPRLFKQRTMAGKDRARGPLELQRTTVGWVHSSRTNNYTIKIHRLLLWTLIVRLLQFSWFRNQLESQGPQFVVPLVVNYERLMNKQLLLDGEIHNDKPRFISSGNAPTTFGKDGNVRSYCCDMLRSWCKGSHIVYDCNHSACIFM